jgi:hypothetical protein
MKKSIAEPSPDPEHKELFDNKIAGFAGGVNPLTVNPLLGNNFCYIDRNVRAEEVTRQLSRES